jgi:DNA modification methylase
LINASIPVPRFYFRKFVTLKIKFVAISLVLPYDKNPRKHDVAAIATSIKEYGWRQPIVVDSNNIIVAGHGRFFAATELGLDRVPIHVATDLSPEQIRAYRLADNKTNELASWNMELLASEIEALKELNYDLSLMGFGPDELAKIMNTGLAEGLTDPDDIPAPPDQATTKPGDIWILGKHRLMCGDSSSAGDLDRLLDGAKINLVNTDPPYNVKVEPRSNNAIAAGNSSFAAAEGSKPTQKKLRAKDRPLANDFVTDQAFDEMLLAWFGNASRVLVPGGSFYIWGGYANLGNYPSPLKTSGLYFSQAIVWDKLHPVLTRKDFMGAFEICFYGWKEGAGHKFFGPNNATDLWHLKKVNPQSMVHLTEKPVELAVRAMQYSSRIGENVLDLFGGSGSTLIAAEQADRRAFLMELDTLYCDVIVERWEKFTGGKATLLGVSQDTSPTKRPKKKPANPSAGQPTKSKKGVRAQRPR